MRQYPFWIFVSLALVTGFAATQLPLPEPRPGASVLPRKVGDLLILRSGAVERSELKSYFGDRCQFGASNISRDQIAWIGFSTAIATPPAITDPAHDEVHLRDGTVQTGRLVAVSPTQVVTEKRSYNRSQIAWIALAIKKSGTEEGVEPFASPSASTPAPSATPSPSATRSPRPPHDAVKPCPADKPLGGHIEVKYVSNPYGGHDCQGTIRTVLRFPLVDNSPSTSPWSSRLWTGFSAPELNYDVSSAGCVDTPGDDLTCQAAGGRRTGKVTLGTIGRLGFSRGNVGYVIFKPVKPEIAFEVLPDEIHTAFTTPLTCEPFYRGGMEASWLVGFAGGTIRPRYRLGESDQAFVTFVDSTGCNDSDCMQHSERYAVIPFTGHSVWTDPRPNAGVLRVEMTWEICCGCGAPPTPPEPSDDRCPSTLEADSRLEKNRKEREEKLAELRKVGAAYDEKYKESKRHYDDYVQTVQACLLQGLATRAIIMLLAPEIEGEEVPHEIVKAFEWSEERGKLPPMGLQLIAKIVEKIVNGEDPTTALASESRQNWNETMAVLQKVMTLLSGRTPEEMEKSLEECQGTFLVSPETKISADKCVESLKEALEDLAEFNKLNNDIRNLDTAYPDLQYKAWAACVERARCKGTPESACDDKKPPGNWPNVP